MLDRRECETVLGFYCPSPPKSASALNPDGKFLIGNSSSPGGLTLTQGASYFLYEKGRFLLNSIFRNRIRIHSSGYEPFAAFSAAVFSFLSSNSTYLYCTVRLCRAESSNCNSSCDATQATSSWKQKRSTSIDETDEINLKLGPLLINNQKSKSELNGRG